MSPFDAGKTLERQDFGDVTVLRIKVPTLYADDTTEALFQHAYAVVDEAGRSKLVLNLDGVMFLTSIALGKLVRLMQKARTAGGMLKLCKLSRNIAEVLRVSRLEDILLSYADEQEAVQSFG